MGILVKPRKGDLTGVSKKDRQAASDKAGDVAGARAEQIKTQSENGFKGQVKNDYGLPAGPTKDIIQKNKYPNEGGPKFRRGTYADGSKGIIIKPKTSMPQDATKVNRAMNPIEAKVKYSKSLSKMNDDQLLDEVGKNTQPDNMSLNKKGDEAADSLVSRKWRRNGGYAMGTKGIKMKKKSS